MTGGTQPPSGQEPAAPAARVGLPSDAAAGQGSQRPEHPASPVSPVVRQVLLPPPPRDGWRPPRRVEPVAGTPFAVVHLDVAPVTAGLAVGSLSAGIGSVAVALAVGCFGLAGAQAGWGGWAAGAFAVLAALLGIAGVVLGMLGQRQIRRVAPPPAVRFTGRGLAIAGMICGGAGLLITAVAFALAVLLQLV